MLEFNQEGQAAQHPGLKSVSASTPDQPPVPASFVASTFVEQYYRTLGNAPHQLHRFYSHDSVFARLEPGDALSMDAESKLTVIGQLAIHAKIRDLAYKGCKALIDTIDFQDSIDGSVLVLLSGYISNNGGEPRSFTQSILLARQERGYYVRNDILRFVQRSQDKETSPSAADSIQPGFTSVASSLTPSAAQCENSTSDICSEGPKENVSDSMDQVEEADFNPQTAVSIEINTQTEEATPELAVSFEPTPNPEVSVGPSTPAKPASWAALFTKSAPSSAAAASSSVATQNVVTAQPPTLTQPVQLVSHAPESSSKTPDYSAHLFVQNLPDSSTEAEISSLFSAYGTVDCVDILPKRTMAFVMFDSVEGAQAALKAKIIMLQGRELQVSARKPRNQPSNRGRGRAGRGRHVARARKHDERQQS